MHATEDLVVHDANHPARNREDDAEATRQRQPVVEHCALVRAHDEDHPAICHKLDGDEDQARRTVGKQIDIIEMIQRRLYAEADGQDGDSDTIYLEKE
eukprot:6173686-Pleurochrysis_carterae.AAC.1